VQGKTHYAAAHRFIARLWETERNLRGEYGGIELRDPESYVTIALEADLPVEAYRALERVQATALGPNVHLRYDRATDQWRAEAA
jgi:hypothetical protein